MDETRRRFARQLESVSFQLVALRKLDFTCPLKVAVFVAFLNISSLDDVNSEEILN